MCLGPIFFSAGLYLLRDLEVDVGFWELAPIFSILGVGMALVMPVAMNVAMTAVPQRKAGMASGTIQTFNSLAQAMGVTFGGATFTGKMNDLIPNYGNQFPNPMQIKILKVVATAGLEGPLAVITEASMESFRYVFVNEIPLVLAGFLIILLFLKGGEHLRLVSEKF